jgi:hypothetical protein
VRFDFGAIMPIQLGPRIRIPYFEAILTSSASNFLPLLSTSESNSENPLLNMCANETPFLPNSSIIEGVIFAGTAIIARSTGVSSGIEDIES